MMTENIEKKQITSWSVASVIVLILGLIGLLNLIVIELFVVPKFMSIFNDLGSSLSVLTQFMLNVSFKYVLAILAMVSFIGLIVKEIMIKQKEKCFFINLGFFVPIWAIIFLYAIMLFLPMFQQ